MIGYGLYWYCIELIAFGVDKDNISFELEEDAETIALEWNLDQMKVQEIMGYMVNLGLFEDGDGRITCLKLAQRLDDTNAKNPQIKELISRVNSETLGETPNKSGQIRLEVDKNKKSSQDSATALVTQVVEIFNTTKDEYQPNWSKCEALTKSRTTLIKNRIKDVEKRIKNIEGDYSDKNIETWFSLYFVKLSNHQFYSGKPKFNGDTGYKWSIDNLLREKNFVQAIERLNDE